MNFSMILGIVGVVISAAGLWASKVRTPDAPQFQSGPVMDLTNPSYWVGLAGIFLFLWGLISKIEYLPTQIPLKILLILITGWIAYRFYFTGVWSLTNFLPIF